LRFLNNDLTFGVTKYGSLLATVDTVCWPMNKCLWIQFSVMMKQNYTNNYQQKIP